MIKVHLVLNDDYAILESGGVRFYYGYEVAENEEWCFEARDLEDGAAQIVRIPTHVIVASTDDRLREPAEFLLAGIGVFIDAASKNELGRWQLEKCVR